MLSPSVEIPIVSRSDVLEASNALAVQFDDTCVVIPDPVVQSRMPRLIKKSYSLPLWRRRGNSNPPPPETTEVAGSPEDRPGVSITVPLPSFSKSRSPSRGEHIHQPLVSCLVNGPTASPRRHGRRPSLTLPPRSDAITVPLRPCCRECYPITEECLRDDIAWEEKFTRGARRRRNSSAEHHAHAHAARHRKVCDDIPGFESVVFADEVEKRRSVTLENLPPAPADGEVEQLLAPSISRRLQLAPPSKPVIAEEAEADLFPLPSPSASSSHLPLSAPSDSAPSLPQSTAATARPLSRTHASDDADAPRESVYYTPDSSPAIPAWLPPSARSTSSRESSASGDSDVVLTPSPPAHATAEPTKRGIPIPRRPAPFEDSFASFEFVESPPADFARFAHASATPPESPELSTSPRRRNFMHIPNIPGPGSFLRAGAEIFKGVGGMGGPVPLSV